MRGGEVASRVAKVFLHASQRDSKPVSQLVQDLLPTTKLTPDEREFFTQYGIVAYLNNLRSDSTHGRDPQPWYLDNKQRKIIVHTTSEVPRTIRITLQTAAGDEIVPALKATVHDWRALKGRELAEIVAGRKRIHAIDAAIQLLNRCGVDTAEELDDLAEFEDILAKGWE